MAEIADRPNEDRARVVERGIVIRSNQGVGPAAEFLYLNKVPFGTIVRVLADENRRRRVQKKGDPLREVESRQVRGVRGITAGHRMPQNQPFRIALDFPTPTVTMTSRRWH
jgi:hypothetical protein